MLQPDSYRIYIEYRLFSVSSQLLNTTPYSPRVPVSFDNFQQNYIMEGKERGSLHCLVDEMDGLGHSIVLIRDAFKNYLADFFPLRGGYPQISLRVFGQNDFPLRGGGVPPKSAKEKICYKTAIFGQKTLNFSPF